MVKVLITGGSGFVGSHVVLEFLRAGYQVVTTVRSLAKVEALRLVIPADLASLITYTIVENISIPQAFDKVLSDQAFVAVIHTAAPFHYRNTTPAELLDPSINGTKYLLESIKRLAPTVKRFVFTSSQAAIVDLSKHHRPGYVYNADDWNPIDWQTANNSNPQITYVGAKTFAELAVWEFVKEYPALEVVTICPPQVYGPLLIRPNSMTLLNTTNAFIYAYINGSLQGSEVPHQFIHGWVDVRNVAQAHLFAYENPRAAHRRFVLSGGNHTYKEISDVIARNFPEAIGNLPTKLREGLTPNGEPAGGRYTFDAGPSKTLLGITYISLEKSLVDTVNRLREFEGNN